MSAVELNDVHCWLADACRRGASDLHLLAGRPAALRLHGQLVETGTGPLDGETLGRTLHQLCPPHIAALPETKCDLDFALEREIDGQLRRFRVNLFRSLGAWGACFRVVGATIPSFQWAGFPVDLAQRLIQFRNGLVLVSGVTGAGKTTTLAMLINELNQRGGYRIITVEEPVEYLYPPVANSFVTQREVGRDVRSFADGLKYGLRQDPDVILVGEIRDRATAQMALSAAETGHLVLSTLHTRDAKGALSRYVDIFPQAVQGEIRSQLSLSLRAIVSQHLLPPAVDEKRELAIEVLINNSAVASAIRLGKFETIDTNLQTGRSDGMVTLDESVRRLWLAGRITREIAETYVSDRRVLK